MELADCFAEALRNVRDVAANSYLQLLYDSVKKVEKASKSDPTINQYVTKLLKIVNESSFALDGDTTNEFAQILGEVHFFILCAEKGIALERILETHTKTPDFRHDKDEVHIFFEVKTLSVVNGGRGIKSHLEDALKAQIEIESQLKAGRNVASAETAVQPYGTKPYYQGTISSVIDTLLEKTRQNIKLEQYSNPNTFLVINLCLIPPFRTENYVLRPSYCDNFMFKKAVTGELWMLAFAQPCMLIQGIPEFEGKPCVESIINKYGMLVDSEYASIAGVLFIIHPLSRSPEIWGLFRSENLTKWEENQPVVFNVLHTLVGENWNDEVDSNGWRLQGLNR